ncbi:hypothetical protein [Methanonatronarchaeum sp. AMET6-2]|nr:hypothetical protein [Methanonatronarchaeum sp. AMET6-2]
MNEEKPSKDKKRKHRSKRRCNCREPDEEWPCPDPHEDGSWLKI